MITVSALKHELTSTQDFAKANLDAFADKFKENPLYALDWIDKQYIYANRLGMTATLLGLIEYGENKEGVTEAEIIAEVRKESQRELFRIASQCTNKSTGMGSNMMQAARIEVYARFCEWLSHCN